MEKIIDVTNGLLYVKKLNNCKRSLEEIIRFVSEKPVFFSQLVRFLMEDCDKLRD